MSWIKLNMRFPSKCIECGKTIPKGHPGLWSKGMGVKHVKCTDLEDATLNDASSMSAAIANKTICSLCGKPAGCSECEFLENCNVANVSPICLCYACSQKNNVTSLYISSTAKKFPALSQFDTRGANERYCMILFKTIVNCSLTNYGTGGGDDDDDLWRQA